MEFRKSVASEIPTLVRISAAAFGTDADVGAPEAGGPPGYDSVEWHASMLVDGHLYTFLDDGGMMLGGAILFPEAEALYVGRIFIEPAQFRKGFGRQLMAEIEKAFPNSKTMKLDTPTWNVRTNRFYRKCGYLETARDQESVYYEKHVN